MRPVKVTFHHGRKKVRVIFKRAKATAAGKAAKRRRGYKLAKMWTKAERMANLRKAWAANRAKGRRSKKRRSRR